jgi:hypothetical protein
MSSSCYFFTLFVIIEEEKGKATRVRGMAVPAPVLVASSRVVADSKKKKETR